MSLASNRTASVGRPSRVGLPWEWGATGNPVAPADRAEREVRLTRAVHVVAPPGVVFRWLGQLRAAPYSYDLIDNLGRRSPETMTRTDRPEVGQTFMQIFTLTSLEADRSITLELTDPAALRLFGPVTVVYRILPEHETTVLRCDLFLPHPRNGLENVRQVLLAWGDLVMMRRQLLNLRRLSEQTVSAS